MARLPRRGFLGAVGAGAAAAAWPAVARPARAGPAGAAEQGGAGPGPKRPNVLFLFADDQRWDTLHALGNEGVRTPNLDGLVKRGVALTLPYIMGGTQGAICVCSRAMLLTGRSLWHAPDRCPEGLALWTEHFRQAGYTTFGTGKWHNGPASYARGFTAGGNIFFGGMSNHLKVPIYDFDPEGKYPKSAQRAGEKFSSELFSDAAVAFLRGHRGDRPFFLYVAYTSPHDPRMAPEPYAALYPPERMPLPPNFLPEHPFDNGELKVRDEALAPWPRTPEVVRQHLAGYYAMITELDDQVGRVLRVLEETGHADDTIVLFAGDNGLAVGQHGLFGKQSVYEHSVKVPMVLAGPGLARGETRGGFAYMHDVFPTVCDLAGLPIPGTVEGKSLVPVLAGRTKGVRDSVFAAYRNVQRMVRDERWKLIRYTVKGDVRRQLFDLEADPWETRDLSGDAAHAATLARLAERLRVWQKETDDPLAPA